MEEAITNHLQSPRMLFYQSDLLMSMIYFGNVSNTVWRIFSVKGAGGYRPSLSIYFL